MATDKQWSELTAKERLQILGWFRDGVNKGIRMLCENRAHQRFVSSLHGGQAFDPEQVWNSYNSQTQTHFDHGFDALQAIDAEVTSAENEIATRSAPAPPESTRSNKPKPAKKKADPKPATSKKRPKKKGGRK